MAKTLDDMPEIITAQHIATYLQISRRRVYELLQLSVLAGGIPNFNIGETKRIKKADFMAWIEQQKTRKQKSIVS